MEHVCVQPVYQACAIECAHPHELASEITVWLCRRDHGVCLICNPPPLLLPSSLFFYYFSAIKNVEFSLVTRVLWCMYVQLWAVHCLRHAVCVSVLLRNVADLLIVICLARVLIE